MKQKRVKQMNRVDKEFSNLIHILKSVQTSVSSYSCLYFVVKLVHEKRSNDTLLNSDMDMYKIL